MMGPINGEVNVLLIGCKQFKPHWPPSIEVEAFCIIYEIF